MCISLPRTVIRVLKDRAVLDDGRTVRIKLVGDIRPGDRLEVYGDLALNKIKEEDKYEK